MSQVFGARSAASRYGVVGTVMIAATCGVIAGALRGDPDMRDIAHELLLLAVGLSVLALVVLWLTRDRVVVGDDGIEIRRGPRSYALGVPKKLRCGQYEREVRPARYGLLRDVTVPITHLWVAVEGSNGEQVLFTATRGMIHREVDWPTALPPGGAQMIVGDVVRLREAIGEQIRAG